MDLNFSVAVGAFLLIDSVAYTGLSYTYRGEGWVYCKAFQGLYQLVSRL